MTNRQRATSDLNAPRVAEAAMGLMLLAVVAGAGWRLLAPPAQPAPGSGTERRWDAGVFARLDAFHRSGVIPAAVGSEVGLTGWRLMGTRTGADASAILQRPDGTQIVLTRGEAAATGPRLIAVAADHVVLEDGGRPLRLEFSADPPPPPAPPGDSPTALGADAAAAAASMGLSAGAVDPYSAALRPQSVGGKIEGFVWRRGADGGALATLGLREGDVILSVGGEPLTSAERVAELPQILQQGRPVEIRYRREAQVLTTTYRPSSD